MPATLATARDRARARDLTREIVSMMARNEWDRESSAKSLQERWGCGSTSMEKYLFAASFHLDEIGVRSARVEATKDILESIIHRFKTGDTEELKVAIKAAELFLRSMGALHPDYVARPLGDRMGASEKLDRLIEIYRDPDQLTQQALAAAGWVRVADSVDTTGESNE